MTDKSAIFVGSISALIGLFIALVAADVIRVDEAGFNAPRWVMLAGGMIFFLAGVIVLATGGVQDPSTEEIDAVRIFRGTFGFLIVLLFAVIAHWVAFGPGDRLFSGSLAIPFVSDLLGRIAFGCGAVLLDMILLVMVFRAGRSLFRRKTED
jgi:hypothetical protein